MSICTVRNKEIFPYYNTNKDLMESHYNYIIADRIDKLKKKKNRPPEDKKKHFLYTEPFLDSRLRLGAPNRLFELTCYRHQFIGRWKRMEIIFKTITMNHKFDINNCKSNLNKRENLLTERAQRVVHL